MRTFRLPGIRAPSPFPTHGFRPPAASDSATSTARGFPTARGGSPASNTAQRGVAIIVDRPRLPTPAAAVPRRTRRGVPPRGLPSLSAYPGAAGWRPAAGLPSLSAYRAPEASGTVRSAVSWRVCRSSPQAGERAVVFLPRPAAARGGRPWKTVRARPVFFRPRRAANVICTRFYGDHAAGGGDEPHRGRARVRDAGRALPRPALS